MDSLAEISRNVLSISAGNVSLFEQVTTKFERSVNPTHSRATPKSTSSDSSEKTAVAAADRR